MNPAAHPPTNAALWDRLRATFARVIAAIGAPAAIALLSLSSRNTRLTILRQLFMLESLVRKLLFAELATRLTVSAERGPRLIHIRLRPGLAIVNPPRQHAPRHPRTLDIAHPETWSAPFALAIPRDPRFLRKRNAPRIRDLWGPNPRPIEPAPRAPRHQRAAPFRIARRFEALRRVLNDPAPHIRRLAIAQRALKRSPNVVSQYALMAPRRYGYDPVDIRLPIDITCAALTARTKLCDTS
ncbi:MAG: hypothetical protein NT015_04510 [Alphaproteobacteria bacterium]|nr:hypothetical protein [Alphaproteobacteria bacterium]